MCEERANGLSTAFVTPRDFRFRADGDTGWRKQTQHHLSVFNRYLILVTIV